MSSSVAAVCQQDRDLTEQDKDLIRAQDNDVRRLRLGHLPSTAECDDKSAGGEDIGPEEYGRPEEAEPERLGARTPVDQFRASRRTGCESKEMKTDGSCDDNVWQRMRFAKGCKWSDELSEGDDSDTDCEVAFDKSYAAYEASPCTTCSSDGDSCEVAESELDLQEGHEFLEEEEESGNAPLLSFAESCAELQYVAYRPFHLTLAERFVNYLSSASVGATNVLNRSFYLGVLGSMRVLHAHGADPLEIKSSLAYAAVYLESGVGLHSLSQRDVVYRTMLAICLAFSYVSDIFISQGKWKAGLAKIVETFSERTVQEISKDLMDFFKERDYILRPSHEELERVAHLLSC